MQDVLDVLADCDEIFALSNPVSVIRIFARAVLLNQTLTILAVAQLLISSNQESFEARALQYSFQEFMPCHAIFLCSSMQ